MKRFFSLILALLLILGTVCLCACGNSGGATADEYDGGYQGEVNVYNWGEYVSPGDDGTMDVIDEFQKRTHIKVNYTNFETNEELYNVLTNSNSTYDVIIPSDYMIARLREEGLLEKLDYSNIPNYKYISDRFKGMPYDPTDEYSVAYTWGVVALAYNTDMIEEGSIKGFKDLWSKDYKDKGVLMFNNSRDAMAIAMQLCDPPIDPGANTFTREDIDRATDKLIEQKSVLKKYVMDQVFTEMETSQSTIAPYYAGDIAMMMEENEDLDYCLPDYGSNLFYDAMCIPTCSKNKENAEKFINFMQKPEIAAENCKYLRYGCPNDEAIKLLDDEIRNNELTLPSEEYLDKCYVFGNLDPELYEYMQEQFVNIQAE